MVRSSSPLRTLAEFVAYARQNPGRVSVGHSTTLVQAQIGVLAAMAGVTLLPVPYKGIPATITDTIGGNLDATFVDMSNALAHAKSGNLRALAVTAPTRNPIAPDWPTVAETFPGYDFRSWVALVGPAGMPRELVLKLNTAMNNILRQRDFSDKLAHNGITPWVQNADDLKVFMSADIDRWIKLAREHNLMPE